MPAICVKCKYVICETVDNREPVWYDFTCDVNRTFPVFNYVTGKEEGDEPMYCKELNQMGQCKKFKEK